MTIFSECLLDHFQNPRNVGVLNDACFVTRVENPVCGDVLQLSIQMDGNGERAVITSAKFRAKGCVPAMACGSLVTELIVGKTVLEASELTRDDIIEAIGGVPSSSVHATQIAIDALRSALGFDYSRSASTA